MAEIHGGRLGRAFGIKTDELFVFIEDEKKTVSGDVLAFVLLAAPSG